MPAKLPLEEKLARYTGVASDEIAYTLANPEPNTGECWRWWGALNALTPYMKHDGKSQPVRRVLHAAITGQPVPKSIRLSPGCITPFCVNPNHARVVVRFSIEPEPEGVPGADMLDMTYTLEDAVDAVYLSGDGPYEPEPIAEDFGLPVDLVRDAIQAIEEGRY